MMFLFTFFYSQGYGMFLATEEEKTKNQLS